MNHCDIITVVRDPKNPLGKLFSLNADNTISKKTAVHLSFGEAIQHYVQNVESLEELLSAVAEDIHAAIINSAFPSIPIGQPFLILSEKEFLKHNIDRNDKSIQWPLDFDYAGTTWPALGRFKEHTKASSWILLDRDVDEYTPSYYAQLSYDEWLLEVDKLMPGIINCARLRAYSSSARVSFQGKSIGSGNGHTWVQVSNSSDINRLRTVVKARAIEMNMSWTKPRISKETGQVIGQDVSTIIDYSVFTSGRIVFVGKPMVYDEI